jgi:hypothetical protein
MAKLWQPQDISVYKSWVEAILDEASNKLSNWEVDFINSIASQLDNNRNLSEKQADIVERIYSERTK